MSRQMRDVVVIGAGPAGMAAATLLAEQGVDVLLLDEQPGLGGQIYRGAEKATDIRARLLGPDYARGAALAAALRASGAAYRPNRAVWQVTPEKEVWVTSAGRSELVKARSHHCCDGRAGEAGPGSGLDATWRDDRRCRANRFENLRFGARGTDFSGQRPAALPFGGAMHCRRGAADRPDRHDQPRQSAGRVTTSSGAGRTRGADHVAEGPGAEG